MKQILILIVVAFAAGCTAKVAYEPRSTGDVQEAARTIEKLTMTQHREWRPGAISITRRYLIWGSGVMTKAGADAADGEEGVLVGRTTASYGDSERLYYEDINRIEVLDWTRKFKQWYVITVITDRDKLVYLLRTRHIEDAREYADALKTLMAASSAN